MSQTQLAGAYGGAHLVPVLFADFAASTVVAVGATSVQSAVIDAESDRVIQLRPTVDCCFAFGASPTAVADTAGSLYLAAGAVEAKGIRKGEKVAVIRDASSGQLAVEVAEAR